MRTALYARVSSGPQELSLEAQLRELREHADREGLEVVEEVKDLAEKRHMIDRPGLDRLRELAASGAVEEVWSVEFERFGEGNVPTLLAIELGAHGVRLRWPGDGGEGLGGEIMRAVAGVLSREEQRKRAERSRRGKRDKARRGQVLGAGPKPRYGFRLVRDERGKAIGYEPYEPEMAVVRRIVGWLAEGHSLYSLQTALEAERVPAPRGGDRWSRTAPKRIVNEDAYLPRSLDELASLVAEGLMSEDVFAGLEARPEDGPWGIAWYGKTKSFYTSMRSKKRTVEQTPREEWTAIPVPLGGSGPPRSEVEAARASVADNRASARVGDRDCWELSRGFLMCADCGRSMIAYRRRNLHYYRCRPNSTLDTCPNRRSHPAQELELQAARLFEQVASRESLIELYEKALAQEEQRQGTGAVLERQAALAEKQSELEMERRGYLRQNARGLLPDADLDEMLHEVDEQREAIASELASLEERASVARRMRAARDSLAARYNPVNAEWEEDPDAIMPGEYLSLGATSEEIRRAYRRFGARFEVDSEGTLTVRLSLGLDSGALHTELSPR